MADAMLDPRWELLLEFAGDRKAELVDGGIFVMSPTGRFPALASLRIVVSLSAHAAAHGGEAVPDNATFLVDLPNRKSFSPDAAFVVHPPPHDPSDLGPYRGAPDFAAEVRSKDDYGRRMDEKIAEKREDYFAAGTQVVWDVDLKGEDVVRVYRPDAPESPMVFRRGDVADAEPAVPGWRFPVDELFR